MSESHENRDSELLIIRRRGSAELESPKGGVWKIAYADFMTAMMAFFLVMWLINATNEETRAGVANYFNPINLSDAMVPHKGVRDPEDVEPGQRARTKTQSDSSRGGRQTEANGGQASGENPTYAEDALFRDPYAVLAAIADAAGGTTALIDKGAGAEAGATGEVDRTGNETYRDPFDPVAWNPAAQPIAPERESQSETDREPAGPGAGATKSTPGPQPGLKASNEAAVAPARKGQDSGGPASDEAESKPPAAANTSDASETASADAAAAAEAAKLQAELAETLEEAVASERFPNVEVRIADGGVLISLADEVDFGMFAIGSAEPRPETIRVMEKVAELLATMPGEITIRGHTDGRPFRSENYDNWRLSTARAHMAYHMLVRGGLDEARVERIEGYADRSLKLPHDPEAAENRRIDILLRKPPS